ncbi:hypothetical protein [Acetivibrio straminisolvens]|uniref:Multimodular transpeptidase-transglycosylase n=1 Tax=Acetivibrio straminisolvens JCM 21531 TaxID=1294263 RepID=W4V8X1_9FIRM|nr:hypothetical protein [Acetivibrio straminisolvens]GAE89840.1 multimodular transpeptidase-transglycosylase [Acetivibrio straminisolvens JCM 21531]
MALGYSEELAIRTIYNNGLEIYTTMDPKVQKAMDEIFKDEKYFTKINKKTSQTPQAAMVIMDQRLCQSSLRRFRRKDRGTS